MMSDLGWGLGLTLVVVLTGLALLLVAWIVLRTRERADARRLQQLGQELVGQLDEDAVLRTCLSAGQEVFRCGRLEITVHPHPGGTGLVAAGGGRRATDDLTVRRTGRGSGTVPLPASPLVEQLVADGEVIGHVTVHVPAHRRRWSRRLLADFASALAASLGAARRYQGQRREARARGHEARRDPLTGLGNRALLTQQGPSLLTASAAQGDTAALVLFDLDGFKWVNDTLGHAAGDLVLTEVARRVAAVVRDSDLAVRLGGDEFAVLAPAMKSPQDAELLADRLLQALAATVPFNEIALEVQASMGIAVHRVDGDSVESLLEAADSAMYAAKREGRGHWRRASANGAASVPGGATLRAEDLQAALDADELVLHFQPQVTAGTGEVVAFEALARWQHPALGSLQPLDFLPLAEREGLMRALTLAIVDRALAAHRVLVQDVPGSRIAVNISARSLLRDELADDLRCSLAAHNVPASSLTIEITESSADPSASVARALADLEQLGCSLSIHEFGTGHSSLTSLSSQHAVREIKIAPVLAVKVLVDPAADRMVRALTSMAHSLGIRVVAEGVESGQLARSLRQLGCDALQGFHVQGPAPLAETQAWLAAWPAQRAARLQLPIGCRPVPDQQ